MDLTLLTQYTHKLVDDRLPPPADSFITRFVGPGTKWAVTLVKKTLDLVEDIQHMCHSLIFPHGYIYKEFWLILFI